ncbi:hypothetical protein [Lentibacillus salinarum]|uniref:Uncharacterized protein n=1 Tax=Lentibacillus salinarum TaxID=446820 RepID=A0ABW3ZSQ8_9BACI
MQKALVTFVVLAVILVVFFVVIEFTGDTSVPTSAGNGIEAAEGTVVLQNLNG